MGFRNLLAVTAVALVCAETNAQTGRPRIVGQPQKQIVPAGQVAQFEVIAESDTPVQYEWYHHEHIIGPQEGGDQRVLRLGPVARNHDWIGSYSVVVRNENGSRRSRPARLVVVDPPQLRRQPVSSAVAAGRTVRLSVLTQFDGFPKSYQWYFNNRPIDGATHRVLWLRRIRPESAGTYRVVVQNFGGTTTSDIAAVQVE